MRVAAALFGLGLAGCLEYDQEVVLFPDGSGKLVRKLAVKRATLDFVRAVTKQKDAPDPLDAFADLGRLRESSRGIAAWEVSERTSKNGWDAVTVTAYFEDVGRVRLYLEQETPGVLERRLEFAARYTKDAAGGVLEIDPTGRDAINPDAPGFKAALPLLGDAKARFAVRVPGKIERAEGFAAVEGRTAALVFDRPSLQAALKDPKGEASRDLDRRLDELPRVSWSSASVPAEESEAFRKAFEAARKR